MGGNFSIQTVLQFVVHGLMIGSQNETDIGSIIVEDPIEMIDLILRILFHKKTSLKTHNPYTKSLSSLTVYTKLLC